MTKIFRTEFAKENAGGDAYSYEEDEDEESEGDSQSCSSVADLRVENKKEQKRIRGLLLTLLSLSRGTYLFVEPKIISIFNSSIGSADIEKFRFGPDFKQDKNGSKVVDSILSRSLHDSHSIFENNALLNHSQAKRTNSLLQKTTISDLSDTA